MRLASKPNYFSCLASGTKERVWATGRISIGQGNFIDLLSRSRPISLALAKVKALISNLVGRYNPGTLKWELNEIRQQRFTDVLKSCALILDLSYSRWSILDNSHAQTMSEPCRDPPTILFDLDSAFLITTPSIFQAERQRQSSLPFSTLISLVLVRKNTHATSLHIIVPYRVVYPNERHYPWRSCMIRRN